MSGSINKPTGEASKLFDTTVAKEWPPATDVLATLHIDIDQQCCRLGPRFCKELSLWTGNE